jgi:hypothetical protein
MGRLVVAVCALLSVATAASFFKSGVPGQVEKWFDKQKLDHFNVFEQRVYSQRYFEIDTYWNKPNGPIIVNVSVPFSTNFLILSFFQICGEYTCSKFINSIWLLGLNGD